MHHNVISLALLLATTVSAAFVPGVKRDDMPRLPYNPEVAAREYGPPPGISLASDYTPLPSGSGIVSISTGVVIVPDGTGAAVATGGPFAPFIPGIPTGTDAAVPPGTGIAVPPMIPAPTGGPFAPFIPVNNTVSPGAPFANATSLQSASSSSVALSGTASSSSTTSTETADLGSGTPGPAPPGTFPPGPLGSTNGTSPSDNSTAPFANVCAGHSVLFCCTTSMLNETVIVDSNATSTPVPVYQCMRLFLQLEYLA